MSWRNSTLGKIGLFCEKNVYFYEKNMSSNVGFFSLLVF